MGVRAVRIILATRMSQRQSSLLGKDAFNASALRCRGCCDRANERRRRLNLLLFTSFWEEHRWRPWRVRCLQHGLWLYLMTVAAGRTSSCLASSAADLAAFARSAKRLLRKEVFSKVFSGDSSLSRVLGVCSSMPSMMPCDAWRISSSDARNSEISLPLLHEAM